MRKYTNDEYITKAKAIWGDKYDYSLTNYQGMDKDVTVICPIHGPFNINAHRHTSEKPNGCKICGHKSHTTDEMLAEFRKVHGDKDLYPDYEYKPNHAEFLIITPEYGEIRMDAYSYLHWKRGTPPTNWTKEDVIKKASECDSIPEFQKKYPNECAFAYRHNFIDECHKVFKPYHKKDTDNKNRKIYAYEFTEQHFVYVGLTDNLKRRDTQHRNGHTKHGIKKYSGVYKFAQKHGIEIPQQKMIIDSLSKKDAKIMEGKIEDKYRTEGWGIINKAKTGEFSSSIGGNLETITKKMCYDLAKKCSCFQEMKRIKQSWAAKAHEKGWDKEYTWWTYRDHSSCRKKIAQYTKNGEFIREWDCVYDIINYLRSQDDKYQYNAGNIRQVCCGDKKSSYGYVWQYIE